MKLLIVLCFVALVGLSLAGTRKHSRGCIYVLEKCYEECEEGTHSYTNGCGRLTPEATCDNPKPEAGSGDALCDYSACYCDPPTVRDTATKKCVRLEECPTPTKEEQKEVEKD